MDLGAVIRSATATPAAAIGRPEIGTLKPGSPGDATVIAIEDGSFTYRDVLGEELPGKQRMASRGLVLGGKWHDGEARK
jgi:dihydroorotase